MRRFLPFVLAFCASVPLGAQPAATDSLDLRIQAILPELKDPAMHGLRAPQQSVEQARLQINGWIRFNLMRASMSRKQGDEQGALLHMGMARHALRSAALSWANDENGDPVVATPELMARARPGGGFWRRQIDEDVRYMLENAVVPPGDMLRYYGIDADSGPVARPNQLPHPWRKPAN